MLTWCKHRTSSIVLYMYMYTVCHASQLAPDKLAPVIVWSISRMVSYNYTTQKKLRVKGNFVIIFVSMSSLVFWGVFSVREPSNNYFVISRHHFSSLVHRRTQGGPQAPPPKRVPEKMDNKKKEQKEREGGGEKLQMVFFQPFSSYATGIFFFFLPKLFYYDVSWNLTIIV